VRMASRLPMKLLHRRNRLSISSTVMPTIVVSESASQAISSAVTAVAPEDFCVQENTARLFITPLLLTG
jgi:hypothetical protein